MEGTRAQILADLEEWALDDAAPTVFWLNGMAGTGKTSIAHSLSERLDKNQILGASFFCSRSASQEVRDARLIIPTIASTLSQLSPVLRSAMSEVIAEKPDVGSLHKLSDQFRLLLVDPIKSILVLGSSLKTYIVVIDALDECTNVGTVEKLIQAIVGFAPGMPLKFILTSRATTVIGKAFHHNSEYPLKTLSLHDVERSIVQEDIKTYLKNSLSAIVRRSEQPLSWPALDELEILLERSDRLFIYAATAVRYIGAPDVDFRKRLAHITRLTPARMNTRIIDSLYNDVMRQAFHCELQADEVSARRETLSAVVFLFVPLSLEAITSLSDMDRLEGQVALAPFQSVIHVPAAGPVTIFHASFPDFIVNASRCEEPFRLDESEGHQMLTVQCLRCLNRSPERNMTVSSNAIPEALRYSCLHWASHLAQALAASLAQTAVTEIQALVSTFVEQHLLHWFEYLSALKELESGIKLLDIAYEAILVSTMVASDYNVDSFHSQAFSREHIGFAGIAPLLNDTHRFLQLNFELIKQHPLQMYDFAHVWMPENSLMRERYAAVLGHTPRVLFGLPQSWEPLLHVIRHPSPVESVAFSPDGGQLASGSDKIVRIWNTATGELEYELECHTDRVWSVAFSHNGRFIVSGSADETVRIWNMATCDTRYTLMGHTNEVRSVAISRNDEFVVSGSDDRTVRIWDTATGELLRELKGHADKVKSVAVSPDCRHIASGSRGEVWIWKRDGVIEHKLECPTNEDNNVSDLAFSHDGRRIVCNAYRTEWTTMGHRLSPPDSDDDPDHPEAIWSVAYSPDGGEIVCGMDDGEVMIWNTVTNEMHILGRHPSVVRSVSFSSDGSRIASGSYDGVRIWDPRLRGMFAEELDLAELGWPRVASHDGRWIVTASSSHIQVWRVMETVTKANELIIEDDVLSLELSRDGSRVVIGCRGGSIQVWNHLTNTTECQMRGQSKYVECVAFSYDGTHLVSGSYITVRIWDYHTGNEVGLYQHSDRVNCVAFSRDGSRVAFGDGRTVRIWSPSTGQIHTGPDNKLQGCGWLHSVAFSCDGNHVISGWEDGVWIWNVTTNKPTVLSEQIQLPDGTRVHSLSMGDFHIYDPVDQEMTNGIPPYLLSISPDHDWITGEQAEHKCWIPPQYRNFTKAHIAESVVCLQFYTGMIILDLKNPHCAEHVMPGV